MTPIDRYPSQLLTKITEKPIGMAKFNEPVFKLGVFQDRYIEVEVAVYPLEITDPTSKKTLIGVRFGQMNVIRFIDKSLLF